MARFPLLFLLCLCPIVYFYYAHDGHLTYHGRFDVHETEAMSDRSERCRESHICDFQPSEKSCFSSSRPSSDQGLECVKSSKKRQELIVEVREGSSKGGHTTEANTCLNPN